MYDQFAAHASKRIHVFLGGVRASNYRKGLSTYKDAIDQIKFWTGWPDKKGTNRSTKPFGSLGKVLKDEDKPSDFKV